jgi:hypothetical protein
MTYSISNDMQSFLLVKELGAQLTAESSSGRAKQIAKNLWKYLSENGQFPLTYFLSFSSG